MHRCRSRNSTLPCRLIIVLSICCMAYFGLRYHRGSSDKTTAPKRLAEATPEIEDSEGISGDDSHGRHGQPPADGNGVAGRKLPETLQPVLPPAHHHQDDEEDADESSGRRHPREPVHVAHGRPGGKDEDALKVYIVEEHHEALPYWYQAHAAESKRLGTRLPPLSLVHIDGHSDGAPVMPDKRYPFTMKFGSERHIHYLMTSNDNFIMGSKVAGLVSSSLWVYPNWLGMNGTDVFLSSLGISKINGTLQACSCPHYEQDRHPLVTPVQNSTDTCMIESRTQMTKRLWFHRKFCYFLKGPFLQISARQDNISRDVLSAVLARTVLLPTAHPDDQTLRTLFKPVQQPEEHNDYLLDIDEDFFGVQLSARQLLASGISETLIDGLRSSLEPMFCPSLTMHEVAADRWFVALLDVAAGHAARCRRRHGDDDCSATAVASAVVEDESLVRLLRLAACPLLPGNQRSSLTLTVARQLAGLTLNQLRSLQSVGLCLGMSLKTNLSPMDSLLRGAPRASTSRVFRPVPLVKLCLGHNTPNESVVEEFLDTSQGLDARLAVMAGILRRLPKPPLAVTICRSSRDGYVPRQQMSYIESGILTALRAVFGRVEVKYDPDLYYGREGWLSYKTKQLGVNFRWPGERI